MGRKSKEDGMRVLFRVMEDGALVALFPDVRTDWGKNDAYSKDKGHFNVDPEKMVKESRPATEEEYGELKGELEGQGYKLLVRMRR